MLVRQPRYSKEEFARRGDEIYQSQIRFSKGEAIAGANATLPPTQFEEDNAGKIVAIDIETGAFEVAEDIVTASERLLTRYPDAQTWFIRIGYQAVYHFGARSLKKS